MKHEADLSDVLRAGFDAKREQRDTQAAQQSLPHVPPDLPVVRHGHQPANATQ
jgi:hypothetical protein